jgi:tetratricopeptide (TPR) repeat protein
MLRRATALVFLLLCLTTAGAGQKAKKPTPLPSIAPLDLPQALDLYAGGDFDRAVRMVAQAGDEVGRHLRPHWAITARQWIDADPARRAQRILAAAALALETEQIRQERGDWRASEGDPACPAACVLDWAQIQLVQRGAPDAAERAWYLAAAALAGGVRDWHYLERAVDPRRSPALIPGLMDRALARFPDDAPLRLERALAAAGRFNLVVDGARRMPPGAPGMPVYFGRGQGVLPRPRTDAATAATNMLAALVDDPLIGAEARMRLGYLHWTAGRNDEARQELIAAAGQAGDADVRFLAHFLHGWIAAAAGDGAAAIEPLQAALKARPGSQSAAVVLAAVELQRGSADTAHEIAQATLDQRGADVDPWRLFLYGHHPQWAARLALLRGEVKP